jgi:hypothetical protein
MSRKVLSILSACLVLISTSTLGQSLLISNDFDVKDGKGVDSNRIERIRRALSLPDPSINQYDYSYLPRTHYSYEPVPVRSNQAISTEVLDFLRRTSISDYRNKVVNLVKSKDDLNKQINDIQGQQAALYYRINNIPIILDTGYTRNIREQIFDSLTLLAQDLHSYKRNLDILHDRISNFEDLVAGTLLDSAQSVANLNTGTTSNPSPFFIAQQNAYSATNQVGRVLPALISQIQTANTTLQNLVKRWNQFVNTVLKKKPITKVQPATFGALPSLNTVLGTRQLVPNIDIHGSAKYGDETSKYGEIRFFTGAVGNGDQSTLKNLFFPETSTWGISGKFTWGFLSTADKKSKTLGLNLEAHYLVKRIKTDTVSTSPTYSPGLVHVKGGFELLIIKEILSGYININALAPMDNLDGFNERFNVNKDIFGFVDFGFKMLLSTDKDPIKDSGFKLLVDFGAIVNGGDVNHFINSQSKIIPTLRLGVRKDIGF